MSLIEKPCEVCGCEIHPLKTDYTRLRKKCESCVKKGYVERQKKCRQARREILQDLGLVASLDNCLYCNKPLPTYKPKFCGALCCKAVRDIKNVKISIVAMKKRKQSLRNEEMRLKRSLQTKLRLQEKTQNA
tara:strand:+ start:1054 stop:1449 length:396 start_codon:yes stop_codon:yes gene_type:complete